MIPISDSYLRRRKIPFVNLALIALNAVVFAYTLSLGSLETTQFYYKWGLIPAELTTGEELERVRVRLLSGFISLNVTSPISPWGTVFTSMFIHGGWLHTLGNMLYLWVFGDNIEERMGPVLYLLAYLGFGVAGALTQVAINRDSTVPLVGASGAISGVLGAYLVAFPYARIRTLVWYFFITFVEIPAVLLLAFWFLLQVFSGLGSLGATGGGVAYWAHLGGFVAGALFMLLYKLVRRERLEFGRRR